MEIVCTLKPQTNLDKIIGLADGILCGSYFADRHYYALSKLKEIRKISKENGLKLYILMDTMIKEEDIDLLYEYLEFLNNLRVDGIFFADLAVLRAAEDLHMTNLLHYDPQTLICNSLDATFFLKNGLAGLVAAREVTYQELEKMLRFNPQKLDVYIFGHQKMASSARYFLRNYFKHIGKEIDLADREDLSIIETTRQEAYPILENHYGSKIYTDYIFCMYEEFLKLRENINCALVDDIFLPESLLIHVLKDLRNLDSHNVQGLLNRLKARYIKNHFSTAYLYAPTTMAKKEGLSDEQN